MPKKDKQSTLGKALQKQQQKRVHQEAAKVQQAGQFIHGSLEVKEEYQLQQQKLLSIIDQNPLQEFLQLAELANQKYDAEKKPDLVPQATYDLQQQHKQVLTHFNQQLKQVVINKNVIRASKLPSNNIYDQTRNTLMHNLRIPRRPHWTDKTSVNELREMENTQFLAWRKDLAKFEETNYMITLTPYEKNIEVWKQLWRVVEKSDILVQVVDGRDILFYRCQDLESYVNEEQNRVYRKDQTKLNFLLINKSDLLSDEIRQEWNRFLREKNIDHMFFSAKLEQEKIDSEEVDTRIITESQIEEDNFEEQKEQIINTNKIVNRNALLREMKRLVYQIREQRKADHHNEVVQELQGEEDHIMENTVVIGMVGYPNVGKSSVINTLCHKKLVGVAARPGKTKHFQTIQLEKELILCDCPGLIFPNAASSRAEMVCNGVLPIDNIKDYLSPVDLLASRIPKIVFEKFYGIDLKEFNEFNSSELLQTYSKKRGFVTGSAIPDEAKAAKIMLKDFVNGRLLYNKLPPDCENSKIWLSNKVENLENTLSEAKVEQEKKQKEQKEQIDNRVDDQFENQLIQQTKISNEEIMELFTQEDLIQLMEGRKVKGIKLRKDQRREIKYAYQRGENIELKKYVVLEQSQKEQVYKMNIKGNKIQQ